MLTVRKSRNDLPTMDGFMNEFFGNNLINDLFDGSFGFNGNYNVLEKDNHYELSIALPGFKKEDINVEIKDDLLTISSLVEKSEENKNEKYLKKSFSKTSFKKSFYLLEDVDLDNINAKMENGILTISLGKINIIENQTKNRKIGIM